MIHLIIFQLNNIINESDGRRGRYIRLPRKEMVPRTQLMPFFDRPFFPQRYIYIIPLFNWLLN